MRSIPPRRDDSGRARTAFVVIARAGTSEVFDLPPGRRFAVGRASDADLTIDEPGMPGVALTVSWDGAELLLTAAQDAPVHLNGKSFEGEALIDSGDELAVGRQQLIVGISAPAELGHRRALTHDAFSARVHEELSRAARSRRPTTLVMLRVAQNAGRINELASASFRAGDLVSSFSPNEPEFLLPDTDGESAALVVRRILERADERAHVGIAEAPHAGDTTERLLWSARHALSEAIERDVPLVHAVAAKRELEDEWITEDPSFRSIEERLDELARTRASVLFEGELNTGKSAAARRLMSKSGVRPESATYVSCLAVGDDVTDLDRVFGTVEAPGGALAASRSPFVVLELVNELSLAAQRRLLLAIDVIGPSKRFLSTAQRELEPMLERGTFERILFEKLSEAQIRLPPLRVRAGDLLPLAHRFAQKGGAERPRLSPGAIARLRSYPWPGNVLELRNAMERAVRLSRGGEILAEHLPSDPMPAAEELGRLREHVGGVERDTIIKALADANHNQTHAARRLGISRRALIYKMEKYGLKPPPGHARR
jgi:two-component system, NtrC family, response regulator AtoC